MAGALRTTMEWLGLAEVEGRYDYDDQDHDAQDAHRQSSETERSHREPPARGADVTPLPRRTPVARVVQEPEASELNRITTIHPRTYNEAKTIGESFRVGTPVIMNLSEMEDGDAKRLVDFAAGLAFGLHGSIERVTSKVFLLSPAHVEVEGTADAGRAQQGLFNQS
ncbi:MAG TPA: cell division protein SepF [Ornithinimicrobium sp.]|uniref:cell division protein SepF n=1 Tax=Ornithinimicrobium sp. TaxID=1977084 RepID=UPI002B460C31|nr:cell division protein SepF [Ornithinimicrobium sp.]HKJ11943.1 cell division protein SepF [Ornithinimicrobium sp.]